MSLRKHAVLTFGLCLIVEYTTNGFQQTIPSLGTQLPCYKKVTGTTCQHRQSKQSYNKQKGLSCPRSFFVLQLNTDSNQSPTPSASSKMSAECLNTSFVSGDNGASSNVNVDLSLVYRSEAPNFTNVIKTMVSLEDKTNKVTLSLGAVMLASVFRIIIAASGPGAWRYYVAGGICAAISHAITTPIDVVKTRQQIDPTLKEMGLMKSTMTIVKNGGLQGLLAGLGPTAFGYLIEGAVKFGIYEVMKPPVRNALAWSAALCSMPSINSKIFGFIICGGIAGTAASIILCPMEALRIRLVAEPELGAEGWVNGGLNMMRNEGFRGMWKGLTSMMCKQVPYTITKNVSFDFLTTILYSTLKTWGYVIGGRTKFIIPLVSAMFSSILSCISSQPGDMLLSVVNAHEGNRRTRDFVQDIMKEDGLKGFFLGIRARFLHVGLIVTVQLFIYDYVKRLCGIGATGL